MSIGRLPTCRRLLIFLAFTAWLLPLHAQPGLGDGGNNVPQPPRTLEEWRITGAVGTSDVILLATITQVKSPPPPSFPLQAAQGIASFYRKPTESGNLAQISVNVDKVLRGKFHAGDTVVLPIFVQPTFDRDGEKVSFKRWVPDIQPNQQRLLLLQRTKGGYSLPIGDQSLRPAAELPRWEEALAKLPLSVESPVADGVITFTGATPITVTVKNTTDQPQRIYAVSISGYYQAKKLDGFLQVFLSQPPDGITVTPLPTFKDPATIPAQGRQAFTFYVNATPPPAWQFFDTDCGLVTPVALRAQITLPLPGDIARVEFSTTINSPLNTAYVGFGVPHEE